MSLNAVWHRHELLQHGVRALWGFCAPITLPLTEGTPEWPTAASTNVPFHIEGPIHFRESIRVTIEHGHANHMTHDFSSTAYWYQMNRRPFTLLPVGELPRQGCAGWSGLGGGGAFLCSREAPAGRCRARAMGTLHDEAWYP
jgi:hypothetical protein